jgi:hypothetical protein
MMDDEQGRRRRQQNDRQEVPQWVERHRRRYGWGDGVAGNCTEPYGVTVRR